MNRPGLKNLGMMLAADLTFFYTPGVTSSVISQVEIEQLCVCGVFQYSGMLVT